MITIYRSLKSEYEIIHRAGTKQSGRRGKRRFHRLFKHLFPREDTSYKQLMTVSRVFFWGNNWTEMLKTILFALLSLIDWIINALPPPPLSLSGQRC